MSKSSKASDPVFKVAKKRVKKLLKAVARERSEASAAETAPALSPKLVHKLRVTSKRLRALLQLYRPVASKKAVKTVEQAVKALAKSYSGQRDALVQYQTLGQLVEEYRAGEDRDLQPLLCYFAEHLEAHQRDTRTPMAPTPALEEILDLWQQQLPGKQAPDCQEGMEFTYSRARKLAFEAESRDDDELYHQCRKWTKYYLYQAQMLVKKPRPKDKALIDDLKQLGVLLGDFHDRCVLEQNLNLDL